MEVYNDKGDIKRHDEYIVCKVKQLCSDLLNQREFTRKDLIDAFSKFSYAILHEEDKKPIKNTIRVFYKKGTNGPVSFIDCYNMISTGHIGNNHYRIMFTNENGEDDTMQIDKYLVVSVEGI